MESAVGLAAGERTSQGAREELTCQEQELTRHGAELMWQSDGVKRWMRCGGRRVADELNPLLVPWKLRYDEKWKALRSMLPGVSGTECSWLSRLLGHCSLSYSLK